MPGTSIAVDDVSFSSHCVELWEVILDSRVSRLERKSKALL